MKYKRDGRVYKLMYCANDCGNCGNCGRCAFSAGKQAYANGGCPEGDDGFLACLEKNDEDHIFSETIPSKIRGWLRGKN